MRAKRAVDAVIAQLAEPHGGVVSHAELRAAGISRQMIERRVASEVLRRLHRGVYALAHRRLARQALRHGAFLALQAPRAVSLHDAAAFYGFRDEATGPVHITVPVGSGRKPRDGILIHRAPLPRTDCWERDGILCTSPARTLFDLAAELERRPLQQALDEAHYLSLVSRESLRGVLQRNARRHGARALRVLLEDHELGSTRTESDLEDQFVRAYGRWGRYRFRTQVRFAPYRADVFFPDAGVIVEVDGPAHRRKSRQASDAVRDRDLAARGYPTIRVTDEQMEADLRGAIGWVDDQLAPPHTL